MIPGGSKRFWRVLGLLTLVALGWIAWVTWQTRPQPLATDLAYRMQSPQAAAGKPANTVSAKAHKNPKQPLWAQLSAEQQNILRPLEHEWDHLSGIERQRLFATAKRYPKMSKQQQERYSSRLLQWSKMSIEQRNLARKRYAEYAKFRKEARLEIEKQWQQEQAARAQEEHAPDAAPAANVNVQASGVNR